MIKRLIGIVAALGVIAIIVFVAIKSGEYRSIFEQRVGASVMGNLPVVAAPVQCAPMESPSMEVPLVVDSAVIDTMEPL